MSSKPPAWVAGVLSLPRLAPYLNASCGDADAAMRLYWWNVEISAAFFGPLHCVELALRNALHARLAARFGRPDWWATAPLNQQASDTVADLAAKLRRRVGVISADDVVAGLSFGFWVGLLSRGPGVRQSLLGTGPARGVPRLFGVAQRAP